MVSFYVEVERKKGQFISVISDGKWYHTYYVGYTGDFLTLCLCKHITNHKGFTGRSNSWVDVHLEEFDTKAEVIPRERYIKRQKYRCFFVF